MNQEEILEGLKFIFKKVDIIIGSITKDIAEKKISKSQTDKYFDIIDNYLLDTLVATYITTTPPAFDKILREVYKKEILSILDKKISLAYEKLSQFYKNIEKNQSSVKNLLDISNEDLEVIKKIAIKILSGQSLSKDEEEKLFNLDSNLSNKQFFNSNIDKKLDDVNLDSLETLDKVNLENKFDFLVDEINNLAERFNKKDGQ